MKKNELIKILEKGGIEEAHVEAELILEHVFNKTREELLLIEDFEEEKILPLIETRIRTRQPIQYLLGFADFMGEKFIVTPEVLIPRDETELLVLEAFKKMKKFNSPKVLDIGTGSGIIACVLGKLSHKNSIETEIIGVDISTGALSVAIDNMKKMNLTRTVMFRKSDLFSNVREKFDVIVSNPPYIPKFMEKTIQKEVKFEPYSALFTDDSDGLKFYKKIISEGKNYLNENGWMLFEMMAGQADSIKEIFIEEGYEEIEILRDLAGIERVIFAKLKKALP